MRDKKYPYIGRITGIGSIILFYGKGTGVTLESKTWASSDLQYSNCINESAFENITAEYLANTYGEVVSPEHAEFIIELAENHGFEHTIYQEKRKHFAFVDNVLIFLVNPVYDREDKKQITIPLPPELNTNTPEEDFEMTQIAKNNGDNLMFGDADKCKEWPCVGSVVTWGNKSVKGEVKSLSDGFAWVKRVDKEYTTVYISSLRKPKTPEEELRDEIIKVINNDVYKGVYSKEILSVFADALMSKFEITKKPQ